MKALIIIIIISIIGIASYPIYRFESEDCNIGEPDLQEIVNRSYDNINEKQLLTHKYKIVKAYRNWLYFIKIDSLYIRDMRISAKVRFHFINGNAKTDRTDRAVSTLKGEKYFIYLPHMMSISYPSVQDTMVINYLNELFEKEEKPEVLALDGVTDTITACKWYTKEDSTMTHIHYSRVIHTNQSVLHVYLKSSLYHAVINYYVRTIYKLIPSFMRPKWFKEII